MSTSLHPIESKILSLLLNQSRQQNREWVDFESLVAGTSLQPDQVRRAVEWLSSRQLIAVDRQTTEKLIPSGKEPPELKLIETLRKAGGSSPPGALRSAFSSDAEFSAALGRARGSRWVEFDSSGQGPLVKLADSTGPDTLRSLLRKVSTGIGTGALTAEESEIVADLLKRGILVANQEKSVLYKITEAGRLAASGEQQTQEYIEALTPDILSSGSWRGRALRPLNVQAEAPRFYPGRSHPVRDFINEVREVYISMGFTELEGNSVYPAFWNFDALFIPQDHPSREMQDTFYVKGVSDNSIRRSGVVQRVAAAHENGWTTGSRGWRYEWRIDEARRLVLRTHNTVLTVKSLSETGEKEKRVFAVSKVYRNENQDYKHLAEFHQMDGIIVGEGLTMRHLMGFLSEFYKKLGMKDVRFWPTFFPYTEPSLEVVGYSEAAKDWIELSGSGVFRPEVTLPMGVKVPVLAWGPGIERLMLFRYGLDDMRALYPGDLGWLRRRAEYASSHS
jgi:phenylalanyl-tRNA synthetase alpha chain